MTHASISPAQPEGAAAITRGTQRLFAALGYAPVTELSLATGRRVDVAGLNAGGTIAVAEVKSCLADFRSDGKWQDYLDYCDLFYFAVDAAFPAEVLPEDAGLIIADRFGGAVLREAPRSPLHASRRKAMTLRFARAAAERLARGLDPDLGVLAGG